MLTSPNRLAYKVSPSGRAGKWYWEEPTDTPNTGDAKTSVPRSIVRSPDGTQVRQPAPTEEMMAYQETLVQRDQHRIYVRDHPGAEPAIILMHGPGQRTPLRPSVSLALAAAPDRAI
jgi:hypothetical protein